MNTVAYSHFEYEIEERESLVEAVVYEVLEHQGEVEIRHYPALSVASVSGQTDDSAFRILFKYISGENLSKLKIAMTAPVITSERIEMTTPVLSDVTTMSFVMPFRFPANEIPKPLDSQVRIQKIPPRVVAVIRFKGNARKKSIAAVKIQLLSMLEKSGIETVGEPFLMRYNAPITPGFLRRNEVGIEVRWKIA